MRLKWRLGTAVVIALASCACAVSNAKQASGNQQASSERHVPRAALPTPRSSQTENQVEPSKYHAPCKTPQDHDQCDLEAQWKAADSAKQAAYWAFWQTILSGAGIVGLLVSLWFTGAAARSASQASGDAAKALEVARQNAEAAAEQVAVARNAANRQLRAYVGVSSIDVKPAGEGCFAAKILFRNYGSTPAYDCVTHLAAGVEKWPAIDPSESAVSPEPQTRDATLHPTAELEGWAGCDAREHIRDIENGTKAFYIFGFVEYLDDEGVSRRTNFAYRGTGRVFFRTLEMHLCLAGNTAT